eukprot:95233_1
MLQLFGSLLVISCYILEIVASIHDVYGKVDKSKDFLLVGGVAHEFEEYENLTTIVPESTLGIVYAYFNLPPEVFKIEFRIPSTFQLAVDVMNQMLSKISDVNIAFLCSGFTTLLTEDQMDITSPDIVLTSTTSGKHRDMTLKIHSNVKVPDMAKCADHYWVNFICADQTALGGIQRLLEAISNNVKLTCSDIPAPMFHEVFKKGPTHLSVYFVEIYDCCECVFPCNLCCGSVWI